MGDYFGNGVQNVLGGLQFVQQGIADGTERKKQAGLASLAGEFYGQQSPLLGQVAQIDPRAASQMAGQQQDFDQAKHKRGAQVASMWLALPEAQRAQSWPQLAQQFNGMGLPVPEQYDPQFVGVAEKYVQAFGAGSQQASGVQGTFVDAQGNRVAIMRDGSTQIVGQNAPNMQIVQSADGYAGINKGTLQAAPVMMGAPQAAMPAGAPQAAPQDAMGGLLALGQTPGVTMTSGPRSPAHNAAVGGKPNSQHVAGTAMDYKVPEAMKAQFIALVEKNPDLQAIDEGDHIHVQQRQGGQVAGQQLRPAPKAVAPKGPTDLERRIELARQMGASEQQIKAMVVGGGQAGNTNTQKNAQSMNIKKAQLDTVQRQIDRLEAASNSVAGNPVFDGGPMDQAALKWTKQGQELEQASASIMPVLTALTRVPGVGAQSDLESRLAQLQLPSAGMHPEVRAQAIKALREYMADLKAAYDNTGAPAKPAAAPAASTGGWSIQAVP